MAALRAGDVGRALSWRSAACCLLEGGEDVGEVEDVAGGIAVRARGRGQQEKGHETTR